MRAENGHFELHSMVRSSDEREMKALTDEVCAMIENAGFSYQKDGEYPSWAIEEHSALRERYLAAYRRVYGGEPRVCGIHAGLECGFVNAALPDMDILSLGPTMHDIHTVGERLDLDSCDRFLDMLRILVHEDA